MANQRESNGHVLKLTMKNFPEQEYLRAYPDVDTAIREGIFKNAYEHYIKAGRAELERGLRPQFLTAAGGDGPFLKAVDTLELGTAGSAALEARKRVDSVDATDLTCFIDEISEGAVSGWIKNRRKTYPILDVWIDGEKTVSFVSNIPRPDVLATYPGSLYVGFKFDLPRRYLNGKPRRMQISVPNGDMVELFFKNKRTQFVEFDYKWQRKILSSIDGLSRGSVKGWVLLEGEEDVGMQGGATVLASFNDAPIAQLRANLYRPDVGKMYGADPYCGFEFVPPAKLTVNGPQDFTFKLVPDGKELKGSPATIEFLPQKHETALISMNSALDQLYAEITKLRRDIDSLLPSRRFTIANYNDWAISYFRSLSKRYAKSTRGNSVKLRPLVSIICPTFQPDLQHFASAVESVIQQSYERWELIIVDDGSQDPKLSTYLDNLPTRDSRIKICRMPKNGGIGAATNAGIDMCQGQWVGFMDHDDLLVEVAIDCMIEAAERSRASVLYSDEDKIDKFGMLSAPAFKPDWNYRLLLGVNYVCHFLMVKKDLINRIGKIDSTYDGAQDHDFLLRISEAVNRDQICHVPEILYHWRITDNSTASDISTKPYAIDAGIACVSDHLKRRGKKALVKNFKQSTLYKIEWQIPTTPRIDIIIPFKDNIETTRMCIDTILEMTQYSNFCITLVDNWSTSEYLDDFIDNMNAFENIRVIRIEETFNYSRINNIAVSKSNAEMLVFMNNDVFVKDRMWLRTLVNEALADPDVGIVGGKFLYPNGSIQHGGVVLGIGGVAGHIHVGHRADDAGYGGRGYFAQELSAVTAACMLVKADVFKEVGGFDEVKLSVAFNDIDLCLKVRSAGYKVIWTPDFVADHHESLSRGSDDRPETRERFFHETQTMVERWGDLLKRDPFYSRHFDLDGRPFYDLVDPEKSQCQPDPI